MGDINNKNSAEYKLDQAGMSVVIPPDGSAPPDGGEPRDRMAYMMKYCFRLSDMLGETVVKIELPQGYSPQGYEQMTKELSERVEGCDFAVYTQLFGRESVELKSITQFMNRDHGKWQPLLNAPCGTVPFEMLNESGYGWGWLHHFYKPDSKNEAVINGEEVRAYEKWLDEQKDGRPSTPAEQRTTTYTEPVYLLYLLFRKNARELVASIAFNWVQLKHRLNELTGGELMTLWDEKPTPKLLDEKPWAKGWIVKGSTGGYCWHVPMDKLADIARVTMITGTLSEKELDEKERPRYEWLKEHSQGRTIEVAEEDLLGKRSASR